jgi:large subunit ribosomal protein L22
MVTASLKTLRQSPRKVRLVANLVKGKKVDQALTQLQFLAKEAAEPLKKLIESGIANAKNNFNLERAELIVKDVQVNPGVTMKRMLPKARGSSSVMRKRTSHITLILDTKK